MDAAAVCGHFILRALACDSFGLGGFDDTTFSYASDADKGLNGYRYLPISMYDELRTIANHSDSSCKSQSFVPKISDTHERSYFLQSIDGILTLMRINEYDDQQESQ